MVRLYGFGPPPFLCSATSRIISCKTKSNLFYKHKFRVLLLSIFQFVYRNNSNSQRIVLSFQDSTNNWVLIVKICQQTLLFYLLGNIYRTRGCHCLSALIDTWWRHQMETFSALLALCVGQWRGALMFSLICTLNKRFSKQSWGWWFETPSRPLWRHCNKTLYKNSLDLFYQQRLAKPTMGL